ncbi:hypothetical protein H9Y04_40310 [Streptomyces sp. TRM66268-LWL]|uniref:Integral membrane protein n=1 Tax=Streptomyces polyasparticus TaxID=2767826 RepID=A0ABR7STJ1_9ACTN|nr:hypothetical protein [Streptomyces polyasparticus]MBC9718789.1 hypothetical protein [Streptomyces polyasparticus]
MFGMGGVALVRAAVFSVLCVTLATTSQVWMALPAPAVAGAVVSVFAVVLPLARRRRSFWQIAAVLVPLELVLGFVFTAGQSMCHSAGAVPLSACEGAGVGQALAVHGPAVAGGPCLLLAAHLVIGVLGAWWLHQGERELARAVREFTRTNLPPLLEPLLRLLLRRPAVTLPQVRRDRLHARDIPPPSSHIPRHQLTRRGPPRLLPAH